MVPNPCQCGISLEVGVIVVAVIEAVQYFYASADIFFLLHFYLGPEGWTYRPLPDGYLTRKIIDLIFYTIAILLAIGLFIGSQMKIAAACWVWIGYTAIYGIIFCIKSIMIFDKTCCDPWSEWDEWYKPRIFQDFLWLVVELYFVYVVFAFIKQLGKEHSLKVNPASAQVQPEVSVIAQEGAVSAQEPYSQV